MAFPQVNLQTWKLQLLHYFEFKKILLLSVIVIVPLLMMAYVDSKQDYWLVLSAWLIFCLDNKVISGRDYLLFLVLAIITASIVLWMTLLHVHPLILASFLLVITFATVFVGLTHPLLWGCVFVCELLAALAVGLPVNSEQAFERFFCVVAGLLATMLIRLCLQRSVEKDLQLILSSSLSQLEKLSHTIFSCLVTHNYQEEYFYLEKKMHQERANFLYEIARARRFLLKIKNKNREPLRIFIGKIEECYEVLQALSLIVYRVEDHATFNVAEKELLAIMGIVEKQFRRLARILRKRDKKIELANLNEAIYELADINQRVLQVVAKEPLIFVIFVQDLYMLDKLINEMATLYPVVENG